MRIFAFRKNRCRYSLFFMKRFLKWTLWIIFSPVILFVILSILLYIPPIQKSAVNAITSYLSENTDTKVSVKTLRLSFPLDLKLEDFQMHDRSNGLLVGVESLIVDLRLSRLLHGQVDVEGITLNQGTVDTKKIIPGVSIKGMVGRFFVNSHGIDLKHTDVLVNRALLENSDVQILLNDSTSEDTTTSGPVTWKIRLKQVNIDNTSMHLSMPGDTMRIDSRFKTVSLKDGLVDLEKNLYTAQQFRLAADSLKYEITTAPAIAGFDYNHIACKEASAAIDSISFNLEPMLLHACVKELTLKEKSGLEVTKLQGNLKLDSAGIQSPQLTLATTDSHIEAAVNMIWSAVDATAQNPGNLMVRLLGRIGKQDLLLFTGDLPKQFVQNYPNKPMNLRLSADGNMRHMTLQTLKVELPGAFQLKTEGEAWNLTNLDSIQGNALIDGQTQNINFVKALAGADGMNSLALPPLSLKGKVGINGQRYQADLCLNEQEGAVTVKGYFDQKRMSYQGNIKVDKLNLMHFMPQDSLSYLSVSAQVTGRGTDFLSPYTNLKGTLSLDSLEYGKYHLNNINLDATLNKGEAVATLKGQTALFDLDAGLKALINRKNITAELNMGLSQVDMYALGLSEKPVTTSLELSTKAETNLKNQHELKASIKNISLTTPDTVYPAKNIYMIAMAYPDTTYAYLASGDMLLNVSARENYNQIGVKAANFMHALNEQMKRKHIDQDSLKSLLPAVKLRIKSGRNNPVINYLSTSGYHFRQMYLDLNSDPQIGINGEGHVYALNTGSILIDTIQTRIFQDSTGVKLKNRIKNGPKNKQIVFESLLDAYLHSTGAGASIVYYDEKRKKGVDLGAIAHIEDSGARISLYPSEPILAYRRFKLNADNFVYMGSNKRIKANIDLQADDSTGVQIYSNNNEHALQDLTVSLSHINLEELTSVIPYAPRISGFLKGDTHIIATEDEMSLSSELEVEKMAYEKAPLGNIGLSLIYMPDEDGTHAIDAVVAQNKKEVAQLVGSYTSNGKKEALDANLSLLQFPLSMANGFISEQLATLHGYANGVIALTGKPAQPEINGKLEVDSVAVKSKEYSLALRINKDSIKIKNNILNFDKIDLYGSNNNPLTLDGTINMRKLDNIRLDLNMRANNFELINAARNKNASAYGRVMVDLNTTLKGDMNDIVMRGQLNVLGSTDVTYVLKDSPLTVEDRLSDLVTFTDFSDTTAHVQVDRPRPMNIDMVMVMNIDQAAQVHCLLSPDRSHYIDLEGGGTLTLVYSPDGDLQLNGRYEVISGEMRYSLPIIPLKTFTIKSGSYVEFTGNILNPRLNLAATERIRTTVTENNAPRTVSFDVGIAISQTLENMGLEFTLEAPEDMNVQNELVSMSVEQRGRLAVTMLATGMYLANNNANSFSTSNALNAYLQSEISKISGKALSTIDLSIGMENSTSASGSNQTDYSFQFAKRFWGNRISVIVGGKVSTGQDAENTGQTLIDNVSIEYRLDNSATRYVKVFYDKSYESLLEGEITEMGAGLVLRKKTNRLGELFLFNKKKKKKEDIPVPVNAEK